jgi:hypothetical protein
MTAGKDDIPEPVRTERVDLDSIVRDPRVNTRELDDAWVWRRVANFRPEAVGQLAVSLRGDGSYVVLDGQHRCELLRRVGTPDADCRVYEGLTVAQEAELFGLLNDGRPLKVIHKFLARLTEGEETACEINRIAELCSWKIGEFSGPGTILCVATLEKIHRNDKARKRGAPPRDLERTLRCTAETFGHRPGATDAGVIGGIGALFNRYEEAADPDDLTAKLAAAYPSGATRLIGDAKGLKSFRGGSVANSVAELAVGAYNKGRRERKLPDWPR